MSPRRLDSRRDARRGPALTAGRAVAGFALTCGVVLGSTFAASADPDAGIPTQADVDAAQSAVDGAAARIAELDATYAQSAVALHGIRLEAARLGEIANGAKWELAQRTRAAQDATRAADAAASEAAIAWRVASGTARMVRSRGAILRRMPVGNGVGRPESSVRRLPGYGIASASVACTSGNVAGVLAAAGTLKSESSVARMTSSARTPPRHLLARAAFSGERARPRGCSTCDAAFFLANARKCRNDLLLAM